MAAMYVFASGSKNVNTGLIERAIPYVVRRLDALVKDILESGEIVFTEADTENLVPDQTMIRKKRLAKLRKRLRSLMLELRMRILLIRINGSIRNR